jgi:hypothetical protein
MNPLFLNVAALAVAIVYCVYATHLRVLQRKQRKQRQLRERVAYMLWVLAERTDGHHASLIRP